MVHTGKWNNMITKKELLEHVGGSQKRHTHTAR